MNSCKGSIGNAQKSISNACWRKEERRSPENTFRCRRDKGLDAPDLKAIIGIIQGFQRTVNRHLVKGSAVFTPFGSLIITALSIIRIAVIAAFINAGITIFIAGIIKNANNLKAVN